MTYTVKEIFYTLQGEGMRAGRPAVFCRFAGCNLWTGREEDRANAICKFCDTDFVGTNGTLGGKYTAASVLAECIAKQWPENQGHRYVVFTGGEPLLQLDEFLIAALRRHKFEIAVETNGTVKAPLGIDWLCVSPKAGSEWIQKSGNELKLVFPQPNLMPNEIPETGFSHYLLQPMDGPDSRKNTTDAIEYCQKFPRWRLSVQTHKFLNIR